MTVFGIAFEHWIREGEERDFAELVTETLGELVKPDREKLVVVADTTTLWVLADVPEARLKEVASGAKATVTLGAVGDQTYEGTVSNISVSVDPATRSVP